MASMPLALSVHSLITSVGADAGFAAVLGLAILALLYFAHARETAGLREEAAVLAQRLAEAEAGLEAARRAQPAASALVPAPAPAAVAARSAQARSDVPFAPVGMAAPALASATRFSPAPSPAKAPAAATAAAAVPAAASIKISRAAGTLAPAQAPEGPPPPQPAAPQQPTGSPPPPQPAAPAQPAPRPRPSVLPPAFSPSVPTPTPAAVEAFRTAPATAAGAAGPRVAPPGSNGSSAPAGQPANEPIGLRPAARVPRSSLGVRERHLFVSSRSREPSSGGRRFAVLLGFLVVIGAVAAVVIATSGTGTPNASQSGAGNPPAAQPAFDPAHVTVAVLNGTNVNQLAHHVANRLAAEGYRQGQIATASNQTLTSTTVGYLPGANNRTDALHVAKTLKLGTSSVAPVDQAAQAVACPPPSACTDNVVVTVGANLASGY